MPISKRRYYLTSSRTDKNCLSYSPVGTMEGEFDEDKLDPSALPRWLVQELEHSALAGRRHGQMLKLVPALLRAGWSEEAILERLRSMYDAEVLDREIAGIIRWSAARFTTDNRTAGNQATAKRRQELANLRRSVERSLSSEILPTYRWTEAEIQAGSPVSIPAEPLAQTWAFLSALWHDDDRLWFGRTPEDSGAARYARNFTTTADAYWRIHDGWRPEFVSQCSFRAGTISRCNDEVQIRRYFVIESDAKNGGLGRDEIGAAFRWLSEKAGFVLRAVVFIGNESLHGWFEWKLCQQADELRAVVEGLRCDPAPLTQTQPVRLAGAFRVKTKKQQTLLYLR